MIELPDILKQAKLKAQQRLYGDVVKTLLEPVVRVSDRVLGTKLADCASCEERRQSLNSIGVKLHR